MYLQAGFQTDSTKEEGSQHNWLLTRGLLAQRNVGDEVAAEYKISGNFNSSAVQLSYL